LHNHGFANPLVAPPWASLDSNELGREADDGSRVESAGLMSRSPQMYQPFRLFHSEAQGRTAASSTLSDMRTHSPACTGRPSFTLSRSE
jgi:hypothetical protein